MKPIYEKIFPWLFHTFPLTIMLQNPSVTCPHCSQVHQGFKNELKCSTGSTGQTQNCYMTSYSKVCCLHSMLACVTCIACSSATFKARPTSNPGHVNTWMSDPHVAEHSEFMSDLFAFFHMNFDRKNGVPRQFRRGVALHLRIASGKKDKSHAIWTTIWILAQDPTAKITSK